MAAGDGLAPGDLLNKPEPSKTLITNVSSAVLELFISLFIHDVQEPAGWLEFLE